MRNRPGIDGRRSASAGFARLLTRLNPDPDRAAAEYVRLRDALEKFFDWHCAWPPEECVDETLDRLALKLVSEAQIDDVRAYARGIARRVLLEWRRRPTPSSISERPEYADLSRPHEEDDAALALATCFERCLATLSGESRTLVLDYYVAEGRAKIDNRRRLARALGLSENALRSRVQRLRNRLEQCVERCTATAAEIGLEAAATQPLETSGSYEK